MMNTSLYSFNRGGCYGVLVFAALAFLVAPLASAMDPSGEGGASGSSALPGIVSAVVGGALAGAALRSCGGPRERQRSRSRSPVRAGGAAPSATYSCVCGKSGMPAASYSIHRRYCQHAIVEREQHAIAADLLAASVTAAARARLSAPDLTPDPAGGAAAPCSSTRPPVEDTPSPVSGTASPMLDTPVEAPSDIRGETEEPALAVLADDAPCNTAAHAAFADFKRRNEKAVAISAYVAENKCQLWLAVLAHDLELSEAQLSKLHAELKLLTPEMLTSIRTFSTATALARFQTLCEMEFTISSSPGGFRADRPNSFAKVDARDALLHSVTAPFAPDSLPYISGERTQAEIDGVAGWAYEAKYVTDAVSLVRGSHEKTGTDAALQRRAISEGCFIGATHVQAVMANEDASAMGTSLTKSEECVRAPSWCPA